MDGWQHLHAATDFDIENWEHTAPACTNTGGLCRHMPALDIDILNPDAAEAIEELANDRFAERGHFLVRIGKPPKRAILLRTQTPFRKISVNLTGPNGGNGEKIELLGDGQQLVLFGVHPDTLADYRWHGGAPGDIALAELPYIDQSTAQGFLDDAARLLVTRHGYSIAGNTTAGTQDRDQGEQGQDWSTLLANISAGTELHDAITALAAKLIASGTDDVAAVSLIRAVMDASPVPHDSRWQRRRDDIPRAVKTACEKFGHGRITAPVALPYINMATWDIDPVPEQEWGVFGRYPLHQTALLSGEGAAGKSTLQLQLCAAHVLGADWLGTLPEQGPALFIDAEDDGNLIHRRLTHILAHYGKTFEDLIRGGLLAVSLAGHDAVLAAPTRSGKIEPTNLYNQLLKDVADIRPKLISIASSANVFAGAENDRSQVQQFISLLTRIAIAANGYTVLIAHPSITGINTDSGLSGNTAWHNSVRARAYLKSIKPENGEQPDNDLRELAFKKSNYSPLAESITLKYRDGLYLPLPGASSLTNAVIDDVFLTLLDRFTRTNRNVGDRRGPSYAPALFAQEDEAKRTHATGRDFEAAMRRLFAAGRIWNEPYGRPSRPHYRIARKG
jgi:RecA-family ATPase